MKNQISKIAVILLLGIFAFKSTAQLSGIYSINNTLPSSATNFTSFTAFATAINAQGVSAPVTVNVGGTSPYTEQVTFNQFTGSSGTNTVTVNGNGSTITFNATLSSAPHTLLLSGADYMFFNNLNVTGTGVTYALACHLWNQSNNNNFNTCIFSVPQNCTNTTQIPLSLSGSATTGVSAGNSGNDNIFTGCTMNSGYYNTVLYGNTAAPFNTGNMVINSNARDFYLYGIYNLYCQGTIIRGNTVERVNRTNPSTCYGIYLSTGSIANCMVENNRVQKLFDGNQTNVNSAYCIYAGVGASLGSENTIRNNVISDIKSNGSIYALYIPSANFTNIYHNTISVDDLNSTGGVTYGIYSGATASCNIRNNLVSITRGGTGTKYCLYYYSASGIVSNNNILYNNAAAGTNGIGYYNGVYTNLASWKTSNGWDQASVSGDPLFTNPGLLNYTPTAPSLNNVGIPLGILTDITGFARNLPAPDAGAFEFFNTNCTSTPATNTIIPPSVVVCPAALSALTLANSYTVNGLNYQWGYSNGTSPLGPYTAIPGATLASLQTTTLASTTWYSATVTCVNGGSQLIVTPGQVTVATTVTNTVPYYEGFEGILNNNDLPNCSWLTNNQNAQTRVVTGSNNQVPNTGNKFASVYGYNLTGTNYYYTNGILLKAGVTYSASMFYTTEYYGYTNFTELSIQLGTSQSTTGLVNIVTQASPASPVYKELASTFTVASTGLYYVAVKVVSAANSNYAYYLSWDDLSITIPCQLNPQTVSLTGTTASSVCAGSSLTLTANGANTYSWSNGATTASIVDNIYSNTNYIVVGTSTLTGCATTLTKTMLVKPTPQVSIYMFSPSVCEGSAISLNAAGASTYTWTNGSPGPIITVTPTTGNNIYSVSGSNAFGCVGLASQTVTINQLPNVSVSNVPAISCEGDNVVFTGSGAVTYQWSSTSLYTQGSIVNVKPTTSTNYMLVGTDANGCSKTINFTQQVNACLGINEKFASISGLSVFPNPTSGEFTIELSNGINKTIEVMDVTGRVLSSQISANDQLNVNISTLASGVYYVKVKTNDAVDVLKIVKQ